MRSPVIAFAAIALVFLLVGCVPTPHATQRPHSTSTVSTSTVSSSTVSTATASPTPTPTTVPIADYLLSGTPGVFDSNGEWEGQYGFYTDASKTVRCDMYVFSGDPGGVDCGIVPGNEAKRTYAVPAGLSCSDADNPADGYSVSLGSQSLSPLEAGFEGCQGQTNLSPDLAAKTKVLLPGQVLVLTHDAEKWTCTVADSAAHCTNAATASFTFGLSVAAFTQ